MCDNHNAAPLKNRLSQGKDSVHHTNGKAFLIGDFRVICDEFVPIDKNAVPPFDISHASGRLRATVSLLHCVVPKGPTR